MKKYNGFTLVEGLLIVLILSVVGFTGYYVWNQQQVEEVEITESQTESIPEENTKPAESNESDNLSTKKEYTAFGTTVTYTEPEGWSSKGLYGYGGETSNEYIIYIENISKDIRLTLQITDYQDSYYEQNVMDEFSGIKGETYYLTKSLDNIPGDDKYQQIGISKCDNGHCLTKINETYNLNANITPIDSNESFNGSKSNLEEIKQIFSSISIE